MFNLLLEFLPPKLLHERTEDYLKRKASKRKESFYCRALAGESNFNICINSDLTVSCNCQDFDGLGRIGDLNDQTFEQIFNGAIAHNFRETLAAGNFPIPICAHCEDLMTAPKANIDNFLTNYRLPHKGIMLENTALCNLRCHMCKRESLLQLRKKRLNLSLDEVDKVALLLREHNIKSLYFFNLGEPFLPANVYDQISIIRKHNPDIRIITSTNGQLLDREDKLEAALLMDYIYISLDGVSQETVGKYQVGGSFEKAYQNMLNLCELKRQRGKTTPIVEWKYVVFRWNDKPEHIRKAHQLAEKAAVDLIAFYPGSTTPLSRSYRWLYHPFFKKLGENVNGGRIVNLNNIPKHLLSP